MNSKLTVGCLAALLLGNSAITSNQANATTLVLDLADIVGGGDGTGTGADQGIDQLDGSVQATHSMYPPMPPVNSFILASNPFVDGVFAPDGGLNSIPVSSTGLYVTGIAPGGTGHPSYDYIWNGLHHDCWTNLPFNSVLGMHANKGITFDLDRIENANIGFESSSFSVGLAMGRNISGPGAGLASLYVIVDGVIKESTTLDSEDALETVSILFDSSDRFLTLLTASHGSIVSDNTLFLDPQLTLEGVPGPIGDYNDSGQVEQGDLDLVLSNWGDDSDITGVPAGWVNQLPNSPDNLSSVIDQEDLDRVLLSWGRTAAVAVPEPAALPMSGLLCGLVVAFRRRRHLAANGSSFFLRCGVKT